jgi:hypothetical protein
MNDMKKSQKRLALVIVGLVAVVLVGVGMYSYSKSSQPIADATTSMSTYKNSQFNFQFNYPTKFSVSSSGPNNVEKDIEAGKTVSGTVLPTLDTITFNDSSGEKYFDVTIFPKNSSKSDVTVDAYKKGYLSLGSACDTRWAQAAPFAATSSFQGVGPVVAAKTVSYVNATSLYHYAHCYYLKNNEGNRIVFGTVHEAGSSVPEDQLFADPDQMMNRIIATFGIPASK